MAMAITCKSSTSSSSIVILLSFLYIVKSDRAASINRLALYIDPNILATVQIVLHDQDSMEFVKRPMNKSLEEIKETFYAIEGLPNLTQLGQLKDNELAIEFEKNIDTLLNFMKWEKKNSVEESLLVTPPECLEFVNKLKKFVNENFLEAGSDMKEYEVNEFDDNPSFQDLKDTFLLEVVEVLNERWNELIRVNIRLEGSAESTLLDLPHAFLIPGDRFKEFYYWDTFWGVTGLLVSQKYNIVSGIIKNFIFLIDEHGYIPNGSRKFYLDRSQPPYFIHILELAFKKGNDKLKKLVLEEGIPAGIKEYEWWIKNRSVEAMDANDDGKTQFLFRYFVDTNFPRPESFKEDIITARFKDRDYFEVYTHIKSGAESGLDFTSKWFANYKDIDAIETANHIPVELNAILFKCAKIMANLCSEDKKYSKNVNYFLNEADRIERNINDFLWNSEKQVWNDLDKFSRHVDQYNYFSNLTPLFYGVEIPTNISNYDILLNHSKMIFGYPGGIPASECREVNQQWDFPNAWAPHQHIAHDYFLGVLRNKDFALHVARSFFTSIKVAYKNENGLFFEKYDAAKPGYPGSGGEYVVQKGFGWTNGCLLAFIKEHGNTLNEQYNHTASYEQIIIQLQVASDFHLSRVSVVLFCVSIVISIVLH